MTDIESPEAFAERLSELADLKYIGGGEYLAEFDCSMAAAFISARDQAIRADERAKVEPELIEAQNSYTNAKALFDELCEYVAQMCEHFGDKRDEVPCDAWRLRDHVARAVKRIAELEAKVASARDTDRKDGAT